MAGPIRIAILANGRQARAEAALTARAYAGMGRTVGRLGGVLAGVFAVRELARAGAAVIKVGSDYVDSLNKIKALTGANDATMTRAAQTLEKNAGLYAKMGQTTGDAAGGVVELTKSGLSLDKALRAVNSTMVLAKAGQLDVADASSLVANTLNTFGLKASQAGKIANGLANAANISSADVTDLAESFKYVSPLAAKAGVSLNQTDAILAELANSGIKASQAGTAFRSFLLNLQAPSAAGAKALKAMNVELYDAQGNMKPLPKVIDDLRGGLSKLNQQDQNVTLKSIFGKTGVTGAQVILKEGTKGLAKYTDGVKQAGAAQKLADAASQGLMGSLKSLKANAVSTAQSLYRQFSPQLNKPLQELAGWLATNQDNMIAAGIAAAEKLGPALKSLATLTKDVAGAVKDTAVPLADELLPALKTGAGLVLGAVNAFDGLPGPLKLIAVQAGIAALVLPRLTAGVTSVTTSIGFNIARLQQLRAELTYTATRAQVTSAAMSKLAGAAKMAAGIGGMVLLAHSASQANGSLKFLEKTASGALIGFSMGGAPGAAIGATAGALYGLASATGEAAVETVKAKDNTKAYIDTLNELTGASTRATRARIFDRLMEDKRNASLVQGATKAGVASRDIVSAVMGQRGAWDRLNQALVEVQAKYDALKNPETARGAALRDQIFALQNLVPAIHAESGALASSIAATKAKADAVLNWGKALKGIPKDVRSELKTQNYDLTRKQVGDLVKQYHLVPAQKKTILDALGVAQVKTKAQQALAAFNRLPRRLQIEIREVGGGETLKRLKQLAQQYKLSPKAVRTIIQATGAKATVKDVLGVQHALKDVGNAKPDMNPFLTILNRGIARSKTTADKGSHDILKALEDGPKKAKADLTTLNGTVRAGAAKAAGTGRTGGNQIGAALKSGTLAGLSGFTTQLSATLTAGVRAAIAAAKAAAKIHSPSGVMRDEVGAMLGKGLVQGVEGQKPAAEQAGRHLIDRLTKGAKGGLDGIRRVLGGLRDYLQKTQDQALKAIEKDHDRTWAAIEKDLRKRFKGKELAHQLAERKKALDRKLAEEKAAWRAHTKAVNALIKSQRAALIDNGRAQDLLNAKIQKTRQKYRDLIQAAKDYAAGIKATIVATGDITQLGKDSATGAVSLSALLSQLKGRAAQARAFADVILRLRNLGLNETSINQLLNEGPDSLATAQAIAAGGTAAIEQINQLTAQLATTGTALGDQMAKTYYAAGIQAAQGLLEGLMKKRKELEEIAQILAESLAKAIKKALGIHSPSTVFRDIGSQAVKGLSIGLDETYVTRQGARLATALQSGFGTPSLVAFQSINGTDPVTAADLVAAVDALRAETKAGLAAVATAAGVTGPTKAGEQFATTLNRSAGAGVRSRGK